MRKTILLLSILVGSLLGFAQEINGYLGMRHSLGFDTHLMPALQVTGGYKQSNYGNSKSEMSGSNKIFWNVRNDFFYTYNLTRVTVLKVSFSSFKTGFSKDYSYQDNNYDYKYFVLPYSIKGSSIGAEFQFYFNRDMPAPIGFYYSLGLNITRSKLVDKENSIYGKEGKLYEVYGIDFTDPEYSFTEPYITTGFGKKYIVAKDKLLLNMGFNFSFAPAVIVNLIPEKEEENYEGYSSYNPVYYTDEPKGFGEIDDNALDGTKERTRGLMSTDFYFGLSWMF